MLCFVSFSNSGVFFLEGMQILHIITYTIPCVCRADQNPRASPKHDKPEKCICKRAGHIGSTGKRVNFAVSVGFTLADSVLGKKIHGIRTRLNI